MSNGPDTTVDPPMFRLRAFEAEWLSPLARHIPKGTFALTWPSDADAALDLTLAVEAQQWVLLGQQVGYFAEAPDEQLAERLAQLERIRQVYLAPFFREALLPPGSGSDALFARGLAEAQESLSGERREFLTLVFFNSNGEFRRRLTEVKSVADALGHRPWLSLSPDAIDGIAWSLEQPAQPMEFPLFPAAWRVTLDSAWKDPWPWANAVDQFSGTAGTAMERWQAVEPVRATLRATTDWKIEYEAMPADLRPTLGRQVGHDAEIHDDWPPEWTGESS
jgi:hypothetical protein